MTSNKLFRAASVLHTELFSFSRPRSLYFSASRYYSSRNSSSGSITGSDLLRLRQDLYSTLNNWESSRKRSLTANALVSRKELEELDEENPIQLIADAPSSSSNVDKETLKLSALQQRFRSRLHTYLQACVLVAQHLQNGRKRQTSYLEAAHGALFHYNNVSKTKKFVSLEDPELFNTVLFGWIHSAKDIRGIDVRQRCLSLRKLMKKRGVKENEATLAAFYLLLKMPPNIGNRQDRDASESDQAGIAKIVDELMGTVACSRNFLADPRLNEDDREILTSLLNYVNVQHDFSNSTSPMKRYQRALLKSLNEPYGGLPLTSTQAQESISNASTSDGPYSEVFKDKKQLLKDFAVQLDREKRGVVIVPSAFVNSDTKVTVYEQISNEVQRLWKSQLLKTFVQRKNGQTWKVESRLAYGGIDSCKINIAPFLCLLEPQQYVDIMFDEAYRLSELSDCHGLPLKVLCNALGRKLLARVKIELAERYGVLSKIGDIYEQYGEYFLNWPKYSHLNHREFWLKNAVELHPLNPSLESNSVSSDGDWLVHELGEFLYGIIIDSVKVPVSLRDAARVYQKKKSLEKDVKMVDAFFKALSTYGIRKYEEIRPHRTLMDMKKKSVRREIRFDASDMPLICPPIPWHRHDQGQLLIRSVDLIRLEANGARSLKRTNRLTTNGDGMASILDSLNVLGSTPWMMNKPVLDVMLQIFRADGDMKLDIPPSQSKLPPIPLWTSKDRMSQEEKADLVKKRQEMKKMHAETFSLWCTAHYRFSLAEFFKEKILWFPHNVDFRGRTYPVPPFLNHMGDDMCRGMMRFAKGRPLGKDGLKWLKIHCINLTGFKKRASVDERAKYADEIIDDIFDSARNPLTGKRWWTTSEEPWQTLAVCMEIEKAMRMENPEEYVCYVPVHQDGSCNGLQHYAALGRDQQGAEQV